MSTAGGRSHASLLGVKNDGRITLQKKLKNEAAHHPEDAHTRHATGSPKQSTSASGANSTNSVVQGALVPTFPNDNHKCTRGIMHK